MVTVPGLFLPDHGALWRQLLAANHNQGDGGSVSYQRRFNLRHPLPGNGNRNGSNAKSSLAACVALDEEAIWLQRLVGGFRI